MAVFTKVNELYTTGKVSSEEKRRKLYSDEDTNLFLKELKIFDKTVIKKKTFQKILNVRQIKLPGKNEQIRIRTQTQLNLISIILLFANKYEIKEVTISTYTLNKEAISILMQLLKAKKILRLNLVIASSYSFRSPEHFEFIKKLIYQDENIFLIFANNHFKITLIETEFDFFQIEGSMNYSTNNLAEQILIENNKEIYDWDYQFLNIEMRKSKLKSVEIIR